MADFEHGRSGSGYANHGCRCDECRAANTRRTARRRRERSAQEVPADVEHGYSTYVNWSCRCPVCRAGNTEHGRAYRSRGG